MGNKEKSMKETGILMSQPMVKATQEDRKTCTRRLNGLRKINKEPDRWEYMRTNDNGDALFWVVANDPEEDIEKRIRLVKCPYGQVGDLLYCRHNYYLLDEYLLGESDILYRLTDDRIYAILTMEVQDGRYKTDEWSPSQAYPNLPQ